MMLRPATLFWGMVLLVLVPAFAWRPGRVMHPDKAFVAWSRQIIAIRLSEFAVIFLYIGNVYGWRWDFSLTSVPNVAAWAGLVVALAGVVLTLWSKVRLGAYFSTTLGVKKDHQLITSGPYARIRHPIYTGLLLVIVGGALVYNSGAALILLAVPFSAFFYWQSVVEEKLLVDHFGEAYSRYREATGRLFPRLLR